MMIQYINQYPENETFDYAKRLRLLREALGRRFLKGGDEVVLFHGSSLRRTGNSGSFPVSITEISIAAKPSGSRI